jgi:hypothetical protein
VSVPTASEFLDGRDAAGAEFSLLFFDFLLPVIVTPLLHLSVSPQLSCVVDLNGYHIISSAFTLALCLFEPAIDLSKCSFF